MSGCAVGVRVAGRHDGRGGDDRWAMVGAFIATRGRCWSSEAHKIDNLTT